jgi:hypothetical protein
MTQEQFETACGETRALLLKVVVIMTGQLEGKLDPERQPNSPTEPGHIMWMLEKAPGFYASGNKEKANRWLGFVQGVLASVGVGLEDLKRANMPEGETFDGGKV